MSKTQAQVDEGRIFITINAAIMILIMIVTLYPIWFSVINSLNDGTEILKGFSFVLPAKFTFASWQTVLADAEILRALWITTSRTLIVTSVSLVNTAMFAYAFSRPYLNGKKFYTSLGFISMYFSGGLIPTFLLFNWLHLYDTYWVYIIPSLFSGFYNVIIFNANYKAIPDSLFEAAKIDGASEYRIFYQIVLPLSKPVLAALAVFIATGVWNDYGTTLFYTQSKGFQSLANFTLKMIKSSQAADQLRSQAMASSVAVSELINSASGRGPVTSKTIELAAMILSALPMIIIYPFAQKFFVKGVIVGSVKG
ncbi:ABC transporter permease [Spirochaetia bacterium]|nr:ABC transporter permease [Spirochaetia bacterium]